MKVVGLALAAVLLHGGCVEDNEAPLACAPYYLHISVHNDTDVAWTVNATGLFLVEDLPPRAVKAPIVVGVEKEEGWLHINATAANGTSHSAREKWHGYLTNPLRHEVHLTEAGIRYEHGATELGEGRPECVTEASDAPL